MVWLVNDGGSRRIAVRANITDEQPRYLYVNAASLRNKFQTMLPSADQCSVETARMVVSTVDR